MGRSFLGPDHLASQLLERLDVRRDLMVAFDEVAALVLVLCEESVDDRLGDVGLPVPDGQKTTPSPVRPETQAFDEAKEL